MTEEQNDKGYVPPEADSQNEPFGISTKAPKRSGALNKKGIYALGTVLAILAVLIVNSALSGATKPPEINTTKNEHPNQPNEHVNALPSGYDAWDRTPKAKPKEVIYIQDGEEKTVTAPKKELSELEKLMQRQMIERFRRELRARESEIVAKGSSQKSSGANLQNISHKPGQFPTLPEVPNSRDSFNRQDDKLDFLTEERTEEILLRQGLQPLYSPYTVKAGTFIPAVLKVGINSDLPGPITAMVTQTVYDSVKQATPLIPQGSNLIGTYDSRITYGQERILIVWTRLDLPNGKTIVLEGMPGVDLSGYAGVKDQVDNHYFKLVTGVVLGSVIGAGAQLSQGSTFSTQDPSFGQLATQGVARNANEVGQEITRKNLELQPTLTIEPGHKLNVFVTKDMLLEPWRS